MATRKVKSRAELSSLPSANCSVAENGSNGSGHHHNHNDNKNNLDDSELNPRAAKLKRFANLSEDSQDIETDLPLVDPTSEREKDVVTDEMVRHRALRWCQDSLGGAWLKFSKEEIIITHISGGMSNYLYLIALPPGTQSSKKGEPLEVLLRIYGQISKSTLDFLVHNSVVFALLAERNLGPKPFGMYHDGRIEEFIKGRPLVPSDLCQPKVMGLVAEKLARFHTLEMPLCKKPRWFKAMVRGWINEVKSSPDKHKDALDGLQQLSPNFDLEEEFKNLKQIAYALECPVVFCHNDLQGGNVLMADLASETKPTQITIIDWEYAHYNYRGFDLGNHFNEWMFDYSVSEKPGYIFDFSSYPTRTQQFHFFEAYLKATGCNKEEVKESDLWSLYKETNTLSMHSHFLWGVWAMVQSLTSSIEFEYVTYALSRFEAYFKMKALLPQIVSSCGEHISSDKTSSCQHN